MTSQYDKEVQFTCVVRGYMTTRRERQPEMGEILDCAHEKNNRFDRFCNQTTKKETATIVGHLPVKTSKVTKFLMEYCRDCEDNRRALQAISG